MHLYQIFFYILIIIVTVPLFVWFLAIMARVFGRMAVKEFKYQIKQQKENDNGNDN